jgi:hypothetical protein
MSAVAVDRNKRAEDHAAVIAALFRARRDIGWICSPCDGSRRRKKGRMPLDSATSEFEDLVDFSAAASAILITLLSVLWIEKFCGFTRVGLLIPTWLAIVVSLPLLLIVLLLLFVRITIERDLFAGIFAPYYDFVRDDGSILPPPQLSDLATLHSARAAWELASTVSDSSRQHLTLRVRYAETGRCGNWLFQYTAARVRALVLDIAFAAPEGYLPAPFHSLPRHVGRWQPGARSIYDPDADSDQGSEASRHHILLRPRGLASDGTSMSIDELVLVYHYPVDEANKPLIRALAVDTHITDALQRQHESLRTGFATLAGPALLSAPTVEFVSNSGLFLGFEAEVFRWIAPCLRPDAAFWMRWEPRDVAIHVRLGDILHGHHAAYRPLPMSFYRLALLAHFCVFLRSELTLRI